jgi:thiamine-monophosphate kinase
MSSLETLGEFELIERYFRAPAERLRMQRTDVPLGIGDDAALLAVPPGVELVAALDTLVEGKHFLPGCPPDSIGHRALAVNLSDLAAMGADPSWLLLGLTLPHPNDEFLGPFARGLLQLAQAHCMALVGGDTTAGPLCVSVQALGTVPQGQALRRSGGAPGDLLYVSGSPGDAAAGLALEAGVAAAVQCSQAQQQGLRNRFLFPEPRVELGRALRGIASACIDVSDGLLADANKLAQASGCGTRIDVEQLPLSAQLLAFQGRATAIDSALCGGDDYELCFTVPAHLVDALGSRLANVKCPVTCIGVLESGASVRVLEHGRQLDIAARGYDHFAAPK